MLDNSDDDWLQIWNFPCNGSVRVDLQSPFNIVGKVLNPTNIENLTFRLNGGKKIPVFFKRRATDSGRLENFGEFNVDTISRDDLELSNEVEFSGQFKNGTIKRKRIRFRIQTNVQASEFRTLDLGDTSYVAEFGQAVDGRWQIGGKKGGEQYLEVCQEDAGLDRIVLLGPRELGTRYSISARIMVTAWTASFHNVGLLYKWHPHLRGDGSDLPTQWTTGLAYYYSQCAGIRLRIGKNVHLNEFGRKIGDHILGETHLVRWKRIFNRGLRRIGITDRQFPQIVPGRHYFFELSVDPDRNSLTVWKQGSRKPGPQLVTSGTDDLLISGSVGVIAHKCGVRIYEFEYRPKAATRSNA